MRQALPATTEGFGDVAAMEANIMTALAESNAQPLAVQIILDEHRSIRTALDAILDAVQPTPRAKPASFDLPGVRALLAYLDGFPDQVHHPKEDGTLFVLLEEFDPEGSDYLAALRREHTYGHESMRALQAQAEAIATGKRAVLEQFSQSLRAYDSFYRAHMHLEEEVLIPRALNILSREQWAEVDAAFAGNLDPGRGGQNTLEFAAQLRDALARLQRLSG